MPTAELAMASPDAASADARPVFLRFGDLPKDDEERLDGTGEDAVSFSFTEERRKILRDFLVALVTEAASELSCGVRSSELGMFGSVWLAPRMGLGSWGAA